MNWDQAFLTASSTMVALSAVPYIIRTWQGKIFPNPVTWGVWTVVGTIIFFASLSAGIHTNLWPSFFGMVNPFIITVLSIWKGRRNKLLLREIVCGVIGLGAVWLWWEYKSVPTMAVYSLYLGIMADISAAIPTVIDVWKDPRNDRPFAWAFFGIGYGMALLAIEQWEFVNWILPVYMCIGGLFVALPLALYRFKVKAPIWEWI